MQEFLCMGRRDKATADKLIEIFKTNLHRFTEYVADVLEAFVGGEVPRHLSVGPPRFRIEGLVEVIFRSGVERERADHLFLTAIKADGTVEINAGIFPDNEVCQLLFLFDIQRIKQFIQPFVKQRPPCGLEIINHLQRSS